MRSIYRRKQIHLSGTSTIYNSNILIVIVENSLYIDSYLIQQLQKTSQIAQVIVIKLKKDSFFFTFFMN